MLSLDAGRYDLARKGLEGYEATNGTLLAAHVAGKSVTATIEETYDRVAAHDDPALFIALRPKAEALAIAARLEASGSAGKPLYGAPFVVKDNIDVAGLPTTAACPAFAYRPERSAFVVERLERAGAIVIGKTNLDQFATGLVGVRSPYGVPRNALRPDLIPGGSSSGSATAVGAGLVPFSLGTDTAGSGRVPAALNGIVGLKPSLGALSASGVVPACRTLDTVSIFARDVGDAFAIFRQALAFDERDAYSRAFREPALSAFPSGIRLGVPRPDQLQFFDDKVAATAFSQDVALAQSLGARIVEFDFEPFAEVARLLYEGPWVAERYAAVKPLIETRPEAFHPITRTIIETARKFDAVAAFEAFYRLADRKRHTVGYGLNSTRCSSRRCRGSIPSPKWRLIRSGSIRGLGPTPISSTCSIFARSPFPAAGAAMVCLRASPSSRPRGLMASSPGSPPPSRPAPSRRRRLLRPRDQAWQRAGSTSPWSARIFRGSRSIASWWSSARFSREIETTPDYRLFALPGSVPAKPGLLRVADGAGSAIKAEVWTLDRAGFGDFVSRIPAPLGIGTIRLKDGGSVKGFLVEAEAVRAAEDVSAFGGWRAYLKSR